MSLMVDGRFQKSTMKVKTVSNEEKYLINIPLTSQQADLYMSDQRYKDHLAKRIVAIYFYYDSKDKLQPKFYKDETTQKIKRLTLAEIKKRANEMKELIKKQDRKILMTEGIGGLEEGYIGKELTDCDKTCFKIAFSILAILNPCCCPYFCYLAWCDDEEKEQMPKIFYRTINPDGEVKIYREKAYLK